MYILCYMCIILVKFKNCLLHYKFMESVNKLTQCFNLTISQLIDLGLLKMPTKTVSCSNTRHRSRFL